MTNRKEETKIEKTKNSFFIYKLNPIKQKQNKKKKIRHGFLFGYFSFFTNEDDRPHEHQLQDVHWYQQCREVRGNEHELEQNDW